MIDELSRIWYSNQVKFTKGGYMNKTITEGNINKSLAKLTIPMMFGILGMVAFNLADTYFVGKLGTLQMAAVSFTFPVVLILNSFTLGLAIGTSSVVSRAVGENNQNKIRRLTTDSLILGFIFAVITAVGGLLTIEPLFSFLGAGEDTMPYILNYMRIWYFGVPTVVIPMVGNNAINALGDTKTPGMIILLSASVNIILDPILIFGFGFIPGLGIQGAALATVLSRLLTFIVALYVLVFREKVVSLAIIPFAEMIRSWRMILSIGLPNALSKMIIPIGLGVITNIIAGFGTSAVAGFGIASKIEIFGLAVINALSSIIPVFVGQNFGASKFERIQKGVRASEKFVLIYGLSIYFALTLLARPLSLLFTNNPEVSETVMLYLRIVPLGYAFQGVLLVINTALNAINQPIKASLLSLTQTLVLYIPLSMIASKYFGLMGIFISLVLSYMIIALASHYVFNQEVRVLSGQTVHLAKQKM